MSRKKAEDEHIARQLVDAISGVCRSCLSYSSEFKVEGLLGITVDRSSIILVNINNIMPKNNNVLSPVSVSDYMQQDVPLDLQVPSAKRKRSEEYASSTESHSSQKRLDKMDAVSESNVSSESEPTIKNTSPQKETSPKTDATNSRQYNDLHKMNNNNMTFNDLNMPMASLLTAQCLGAPYTAQLFSQQKMDTHQSQFQVYLPLTPYRPDMLPVEGSGKKPISAELPGDKTMEKEKKEDRTPPRVSTERSKTADVLNEYGGNVMVILPRSPPASPDTVEEEKATVKVEVLPENKTAPKERVVRPDGMTERRPRKRKGSKRHIAVASNAKGVIEDAEKDAKQPTIKAEEDNILQTVMEIVNKEDSLPAPNSQDVERQDSEKEGAIIPENDEKSRDERGVEVGEGMSEEVKMEEPIEPISFKDPYTGRTRRIFECPKCQKVMQSGWKLRRHMSSHTGKKPYECETCNKQFVESALLKRHIRTHSGEKPFRCEVCCRVFTDSGNLKKHTKIHTSGKPFECYMCGEGFYNVDDLYSHLGSHTGEKPFECQQCGKMFSQAGHLTIHKIHYKH